MPEALEVRTAHDDMSQVVKDMAPRVDDVSIRLPADRPIADGEWVRFTVLLRDGTTVFEGVGRSQGTQQEGRRFSVLLSLLQFDERNEIMYERMLLARDLSEEGEATGTIDISELKEVSGPKKSSIPPPVPSRSSLPPARTSLSSPPRRPTSVPPPPPLPTRRDSARPSASAPPPARTSARPPQLPTAKSGPPSRPPAKPITPKQPEKRLEARRSEPPKATLTKSTPPKSLAKSTPPKSALVKSTPPPRRELPAKSEPAKSAEPIVAPPPQADPPRPRREPLRVAIEEPADMATFDTVVSRPEDLAMARGDRALRLEIPARLVARARALAPTLPQDILQVKRGTPEEAVLHAAVRLGLASLAAMADVDDEG